MKKWLAIPLALLMVASVIFTGCGDKEETGGSLRLAEADYGWESTDPVYYESFIGWAIYDQLLAFNDKGQIIPWIAESYELSEDGLTWTFHIRKDVKWHDGTQLTANDVKFSVDRFGDMELSTNPWSWYISPAYNKKDSIVVDEYTYQFVSDHPEPAQSIVFAWTRVLPKAYYEKLGMDEYRKQPMGSGPWKFVELIPETSYKLEANKEYWREGGVPRFDFLESTQVPEESTRVAMFERGETDFLFANYDRLKEFVDKGYKTIDFGFPTLANVTFQGTWLSNAGATGDIRVRQAMSYSLNRQEICDTWFQGFGIPGGTFFMHRAGYGYSDRLAPDPYDLDKAKQLLAEAGYPDKFADPTIHFYTTAAGQDFILMLFGYWEKAGLQMKLEVVDATVNGAYFFSFVRLEDGAPNAGWMFSWVFGSYFNSTYHSSNMYCSWGVHNAGNDPKADELYIKATTERDADLAVQYYADFQAYAKTMYVNVGIAEVQPAVCVSNRIGECLDRAWVSIYDAAAYITHAD